VHRLRTVRREEVILPESTLALLERNVFRFIEQRDKLHEMRLGLKKGLLFYGPPGTGKTHTIHYLASQMKDHTTLLITAQQVALLDEYVQLARFLQPAMVALEDVDLIARTRTSMRNPCEESLLNRLLNEMDGLREDAQVLFVLTTNRPGELEEALTSRPGRIDQAIEFPLPDEDGRRKLVQLYSGSLKLGDGVLSVLVQKTKGGSGAFIKELMRRAIPA
jgi:ATP-dependent 26S proteasome regulatory subunit